MASTAPSIATPALVRTGNVPAPVGMTLSDWRDLDTTAALAAWDALARTACETNPFYESWHLLPSLRTLDPAGKVRIARFELAGRLVGLMPITRETGYYGYPAPHLRNWAHANCFLGTPLVANGHEADFWRAMLACADRAPGAALFLHLAPIPLDGPLHDALRQVLCDKGRPAFLVHRQERAMLRSSLPADAYFEEAVGARKRKELRRQARRLAEQGDLRVERETSLEGLDGWIEDFLRLEAGGWKGQAGSALAASSATVTLFTQAMRGAAGAGKLERLALTLDNRRIAMLATFLSPPGAFSYKTAYDESLARFSPGVLLQRENLQLLAREDIAWCDSCAAADHPMIDHLWRERRAIGRYSIAIGGLARRAAFRLLSLAESRGQEPPRP